MISDIGFFFESYINQTNFQLDYNENDHQTRVEEEPILVSVLFYSSQNSEKQYRIYPKIFEIIASLGGIIKFIMVTFAFINYFFNKVDMNLVILNSLFSFNTGELNLRNNASNDQLKNKENSNVPFNSNNTRIINNFILEGKPTDERTVIDNKNGKNNKPKKASNLTESILNLSDRLKLIFCQCFIKRFKHKQINDYIKGQEILEKKLDIIYILKN